MKITIEEDKLISDIHLGYHEKRIDMLREALKKASLDGHIIENKMILEELDNFFKWKVYHLHYTNEPDVVFDMLDLMLEYGANCYSTYHFSNTISLAYLKAKTPASSVKNLPEERKSALPLALRLYFDKSPITPEKYILKCPAWHIPYVENLILTRKVMN
jgi:hypothetical protein